MLKIIIGLLVMSIIPLTGVLVNIWVCGWDNKKQWFNVIILGAFVWIILIPLFGIAYYIGDIFI